MAKVGDTINYKGQLYTAIASFERDRKGGGKSVILQWLSACAECGKPFTITTPAASKKFEPNRRCQTHKRPGCRVPASANVVDLAEHRDRVVWGIVPIVPKGGEA